MKIILAVPNDGTPKLVKLKKNISRCQRCVYNGGFKIKQEKIFSVLTDGVNTGLLKCRQNLSQGFKW